LPGRKTGNFALRRSHVHIVFALLARTSPSLLFAVPKSLQFAARSSIHRRLICEIAQYCPVVLAPVRLLRNADRRQILLRIDPEVRSCAADPAEFADRARPGGTML
jgi:hypothetical protein